jgi:hypothetical protein
MGSLINDNCCDWNHGAVFVPAYGGGYAGWGRPPPGYGGRNGWQSGNNINISGNTINTNNSRRWSPDNSRRATGAGTGPATRPATRRTRGDFGYAAGASPRPGGQAGAGNAFGGYNRASTTRQDSLRGQQSLAGARAGGSVPPRPGATRPGATRPAATKPTAAAPRPAATRPNASAPPRPTNLNRTRPNAGGAGGPAAFSARPAGADRAASLRGRGSMGSAQRQGFRPPARGRGR